MRAIKFRARRIDNGNWVYGDYFKTPLTDENSGMPSESGCFFLSGNGRFHCIGQDGVSYVIDPKTLGQFTGLRDKNEKDIYEGDIITLPYNPNAYVEWDFEMGQWSLAFSEQGYAGALRSYNISQKVIGNIYEHSELLKESERG